jgi:hypothetical protein
VFHTVPQFLRHESDSELFDYPEILSSNLVRRETFMTGCAIAQVAWFRAQVKSLVICRRRSRSATREGFLRLPILIPPTAPHTSSILQGWYNRSVADVPSGLSLTPPQETEKKQLWLRYFTTQHRKQLFCRTHRKESRVKLSTVGLWRHCVCAEVFPHPLPRNGLHNSVVHLLRACYYLEAAVSVAQRIFHYERSYKQEPNVNAEL